MQRERLGSRLGFILLSAGCAIGIGNVWKFPYMVGQYGGAIFVLIYLAFMVILGIPVMAMEFSMGRASQKSVVKLYQELEPKKTKWHIHGYVALAANVLLMMFYICVAGWLFYYFWGMLTGKFVGLDVAGVSNAFDAMLGEGVSVIIFMAILVAVGFFVCSIGLQNGLERITKVMMVAMLFIMLILAVNSVFLDGGKEGLKFYLIPDVQRLKEAGIANAIFGAMNQSFFSLSLGIGCMAIFGSYIGKDRSLMGESVNVALLDTCVAFVSGLIIFPACSAFGVEANSGHKLIFLTLPNIFNNMPLGRLWGTLFFLFMMFAAISTLFAVFENIISCTMELTGWSRKKTCLIDGVAMFILALPCALGFNVWSFIQPLGAGTSIMDLEDFAVSNILLPIGSLLVVLFCVCKKGWGWKNFMTEVNIGKGVKFPKWLRWYMTIVVPVLIIFLFVLGMYNFFK